MFCFVRTWLYTKFLRNNTSLTASSLASSHHIAKGGDVLARDVRFWARTCPSCHGTRNLKAPACHIPIRGWTAFHSCIPCESRFHASKSEATSLNKVPSFPDSLSSLLASRFPKTPVLSPDKDMRHVRYDRLAPKYPAVTCQSFHLFSSQKEGDLEESSLRFPAHCFVAIP